MKPIVGSIVALVTPMHEDGSVDYAGLRKLIDWHIAEGTDCIGVVGTTGESPTVDVHEHCEIIRVAVQHAAGRVPIMVLFSDAPWHNGPGMSNFYTSTPGAGWRRRAASYTLYARWPARRARSATCFASAGFTQCCTMVPVPRWITPSIIEVIW